MKKFLKTSIIFILYLLGVSQANAASKYYAGLDLSAQQMGLKAELPGVIDNPGKKLYVDNFYNTMTAGPTIFAGVNLDNYNLKVETFYSYFSEDNKVTNGLISAKGSPFRTSTSITTNVVGLDFKPYIKFTEKFSGSLIAGANYYYIRTHESSSLRNTNFETSQTVSKFAPSIGFGLEYAFNPKFTLRGQYKHSFIRTKFNEDKSLFLTKLRDIDTFSVGLAYNF